MNGAFANDVALQYAVVSAGAHSLGAELFRGCTALTDVVLPETVETWGSGIFTDASESLVVHVSGSKMQELAEEQGVNWTNDPFTIPQLSGGVITVTGSEGGVVSPVGDVVKVVGSVQYVSAVPDRGYLIQGITVNGVEIGFDEPIVNIQGGERIEVTFAPDPDYVDEYALDEAAGGSAPVEGDEHQSISIVVAGAESDDTAEQEGDADSADDVIGSLFRG